MKDEDKYKFQAEAALLELTELKGRPTSASPAQRSATQYRAPNKKASAEAKMQVPISREMLVRLIDWIKEV